MSWDEVVGHKGNIEILSSLLTADRIPHALLFAGPEGVGKKLVSRVFAQGILCSQQDDRPCGQCPSCRAVLSGVHPDLMVTRPEGQNIKIDQIRQLQHQAGLAGHLGSRRICILEDADRLNEQAGNSLLKLLEDPPADMVFILITAKPYALLPTIVSRCSLLRFQSLPVQALQKALQLRGNEKELAAIAARLSGGRMGMALELLQPQGLTLRNQALELLLAQFTMQMPQLLDQAAAIETLEQERVFELLRYFLFILRDVLMYHYCGNLKLIYNTDIPDEVSTLAKRYTADSVFLAIKRITSAQQAIKARANIKLTVEAMLIELQALVRGENIADSSRGAL